MWLLVLALTAPSAGVPASPPSADPCAMVTSAEAASLLGAGTTNSVSEGPVPDEDTGAQRSVCVYQSTQLMLVVMVLEFPTADAARSTLTKEMVSAQLEDETAKVESESGLGDLAYWGTTDHSVAYVVLRGARVLGVVLGGDALGDPLGRRAALRTMTATATRRL
jgi:hypothetical protein